MKYHITIGLSMDVLERSVEGWIEDGWETIGGVTIDNGGFYQAFIKK